MVNQTFGSDAQQAMMIKSAALWQVAGANPALSWNGRTVSLSATAAEDPVTLGANLALLQGATSYHFLPLPQVDAVTADLELQGFRTSFFHQCAGGEQANDRAVAYLEQASLPQGLTAHWVDDASPDAMILGIGALSVSAGVTPACEDAMRGKGPKSAVLAICDPAGEVVASGMSFLGYPPSSPHADQAFWGMLVTREDWRGRGLAPHVGASLIRRMWDAHGARGFFTGINPDNPVSERMCASLGVERSGFALLACSNPAAFPDGRITR